MSSMTPQTYASHVYRPTAWVVTWFGAATALLLLAWAMFQSPSAASIGLMLLALAVVSAITLLRGFALRLQNRIIRAEMRARLIQLGLGTQFDKVTVPQLVALRFASDRELPPLLARTIAESLKPDAIKRAVTDWQGDHLRT
jgi:hypothetical protein